MTSRRWQGLGVLKSRKTVVTQTENKYQFFFCAVLILDNLIHNSCKFSFLDYFVLSWTFRFSTLNLGINV